MKHGNAGRKALLALSLIGLIAGAMVLSDGMCGGGGGGYRSNITLTAK